MWYQESKCGLWFTPHCSHERSPHAGWLPARRPRLRMALDWIGAQRVENGALPRKKKPRPRWGVPGLGFGVMAIVGHQSQIREAEHSRLRSHRRREKPPTEAGTKKKP